MNWYKLASIDNYSWIDPNGNIYSCDYLSHSEWIGENVKFLINSYKYDILSDYFDDRTPKDYDRVIIDFLLRKGWIRFTWEDITFIFEIKNIKDDILSNIEKIIFDEIQPENYNRIWIEVLSEESIIFLWEDFIKSGESFKDFVRSKMR
jgi:hypothetical protein